MDLIKTEDKSSVVLFTLRLSEGEVQVVVDALSFLLRTLSDSDLQKVFKDEKQRLLETPSETKEFVTETYEELMLLIQENCRTEFLADRYKLWRKSQDE